MIMTLFLIFLSITFLFLIVGYIIKSELMIIIGFLMFVLLAIPLLNQDLDVRTGSTINSTYDYNTNGTYVSSNDIITYNWEGYTDTIWYGLFFLLIGISGEFSVWYMGYRGKDNEDE